MIKRAAVFGLVEEQFSLKVLTLTQGGADPSGSDSAPEREKPGDETQVETNENKTDA